MASFDGASTQWKSIAGRTSISNNAVQNIEALAASEASGISSTIAQLRTQAEGYASAVTGNITECMNFSANVARITFVPPTFVPAHLQDAENHAGTPPTVSAAPQSDMGVFSGALSLSGHSAGSANPPAVGSVPSVGEASGSSIAAPVGAAVGVTIAPAPSFSISVAATPDAPALGAVPAVSVAAVDFPALAELVPPLLDDTDIAEALARLRSAGAGAISIPRPDLAFPQVFEVAGSLLAGSLVIDADMLIDDAAQRVGVASDAHDKLVAGVWSRRGLAAPSDTVVEFYNGAMRDEALQAAGNNAVATRARWSDDAVRAAYEVGVAAHGMMIQLEVALDEIEFSALLTQAEAALERARAGVLAYNGAAAMFRAKLTAMTGEYAQAEAAARRYRSQADLVQEQGKANRVVGDAFRATERAKQVRAQQFEAAVGVDETRVKAFESEMRGLAAKAKTLQLTAENYKMQVLSWEAGVAQVRAQYKQASNKGRAAAAKNQAAAAKVKLTVAQNEAVAAEARRAAAQTAAKAAELRAQATERSSRHMVAEAKNAAAAAAPAAAAAKYEGDLAAWAARMEARAGVMAGHAAEQSAAARFYVAAAESDQRATVLEQGYKQQLAEAYRTAADAAAKAGAAVESGRLSGYRASATLAASGGLNANERFSLSNTESFSNSVTESDTESYRTET
jgi:hypothetical protein